MYSGRHGGLAGKARFQRTRRRAARMYTRQLIEEYQEPDEVFAGPVRFVPIGRRADFLPTTAHTTLEGDAKEMNTQLRLELNKDQKRTAQETASPKAAASAAASAATPIIPARSTVAATFKNLAFRPRPVKAAGSAEPFSLPRFLWGCAIGGVAAAVALLLLRAVV